MVKYAQNTETGMFLEVSTGQEFPQNETHPMFPAYLKYLKENGTVLDVSDQTEWAKMKKAK